MLLSLSFDVVFMGMLDKMSFGGLKIKVKLEKSFKATASKE